MTRPPNPIEPIEPGRRGVEAYDVPVTRLGGGRGADRRSRLAVAGVIVFAAGVVAIALAPGRRPAGDPDPSGEPSGVALHSPSPSPRATRRPLPTETPIRLPEVVSQQLPGAPDPAFYRRDGEDLEILVWRESLGSLEVGAVIPGAFSAFGEDDGIANVSPDGRAVVLQRFGRAVAPGPSNARLVGLDLDGVAWEGTVSSFTTTVWAADSRAFALAIAANRWAVVRLHGGRAVATEYRLDLLIPGAPSPDPGGQPIAPEVTPVAFSADGTWVYGGRFADAAGLQAVVRLETTTGVTERLETFPTGGPERPLGGILGDASADGRTVDLVPGSTLRVADADGAPIYEVVLGEPVASTHWLDDGSLVVATGGLDPGIPFRLRVVDPGGAVGPVRFEAAPPVNASLIEVRRGHALLIFFGVSPRPRVLLVLVRLADGRAAAVEVEEAALPEVIGLGWLEDASS